MAGRGPAPKDPAQRRNRHAPQRGEWVDLAPLDEPVLPELPEPGDWDWPQSTKRMWDAWRADPVTAMWSESDVAYAFDTISLHASMTPSSANEIRIRMDGLGLTPKGKRDLRWRVAAAGEVVDLPERKSASERMEEMRKRASAAGRAS